MPKRVASDFDEDRPRRPRRSNVEVDEPRRSRTKRRRKKIELSLCGLIPLDLGLQFSIAGLIGVVCFAIALFSDRGGFYIPGVIACVWGCAALAKNNGRSEFFGVLGLFGPIGFAFSQVLAKPK